FINTSIDASFAQWKEGANTFSTDTNTTRVFNNAGTYQISLTVDSGKCGVANTTIKVISPPEIKLGSDTSVCDSLVLDAGNSGANFLWSTGATTQTIIVDGSGVYHVRVIDLCGIDFDTIIVNIYPTDTTFLISQMICEGDSTVIFGDYRKTTGVYFDTLTSVTSCDSIVAIPLIVSPNFELLESDTICPGDSAFLVGAWQTEAGTYHDSLSSSQGCDSVIITNLTIDTTIKVSFTGLANNYCNNDDPVVLTGSPAGGWFTGPGVINNQFKPSVGPGTYTVNYHFTGTNCMFTSSQQVVVDNCTGIHSIQLSSDSRIFPNPNMGRFVLAISLPEKQDIRIIICNSLGQVILDEYLLNVHGKLTKSFDLSQSGSGIYYTRIIPEKSADMTVVQLLINE
ncbi:MAG: T9SS type A sorting domain-containing protein, partial [Bacteroidetes bacterium]|nr:T9SS type A sorting domain-containing protein [Bacteroidota bacterium]